MTSKARVPTGIVVLDSIPFDIEMPALVKKLRLRSESAMSGDLARLAAEAQHIARPKGLYRLAFVEDRSAADVIIDGVRFSSRVLQVNLQDTHRAFLYVATCGVELAEWYGAQDGLLEKFWAETIAEMALRAAIRAVRQDLERRYRPGPLSTMNPGSLADWPLEQQRELFELLGNTEETVGVRLNESMLMLPTKSVSGILFATNSRFESCQLCPREHCRERRAPYDPTLMDSRYGGS